MMLSDMGAEVIRVDRIGAQAQTFQTPTRYRLVNRGRRSVAIDLKLPAGIEVLLRLALSADVLIEGFRPGVMERLGLGPEHIRQQNARLVYGRATGWGQSGPLAQSAGHDINYIAVSGTLNAIGRSSSPPTVPLNLIGDFAGGGVYLAYGILCALIERDHSGQGQVVDAAMVDTTASLSTAFFGMDACGQWSDARGDNLLDGGSPWYDVYETSDSKYIAIGAIEPVFYDELVAAIGLGDSNLPDQYDRSGWPAIRERFTEVFKTRTRDDWAALLEGTDACLAPVLTFSEAGEHRHLASRGTLVTRDGVRQPAPAPRFGRSEPSIQGPPPERGEHTRDVLRDWGFNQNEIEVLVRDRTVGDLQ